MDLFLLLIVIALLIVSISRWKVHPFMALLFFGFLLGIGSGIGPAESVHLLMEGFAQTLQWIAVIMIFGALIGEITSETGGAERIANSTLQIAGEKRLCPAMGVTGYIISIPVFVDIAYIMMQTVTEALAAKSKRSILSVGLSLAAGLTATHALMPPTPGPLSVAGILDAQLGRVILINAMVALSAMAGGLAFAMLYCSRIRIEYDTELQEKYSSSSDGQATESTSGATLLALLPIVVPLVLIAVRSFMSDDNQGVLFEVIRFLGIPFVALFIGVLLALLQYGKEFSMARVAKATERSIEKAAMVIMITGAGGAFGYVIKNSGVTEQIETYAANFGAIGFLFPFVLASVFTTATGSLTVSMVTSAGIMSPLMPALGISPEMTAALIGSGAFCVFHINSSFFWLLNRLHKVPPAVLLKTYTMQSMCMGLSGLAAVMMMRLLGVK